ncbi:hypothetical protein RT717_21140 [Imperialibacter roseus]|uniref:Glycosyltransferase RgtA/B/C/D-like domain-containing protein n=1 Tax=Imperialibacter roseus TaxID=1324217 RepID=A0ABZ0IMN9_9BACT|nr:hypothetical protein [Imperialibacter roseus]WOK05585.1 hypothetical protein RT717_21140 [Imperialibacter roseus]
MGLQDLIVTPIYLLLLYALAYWIRPKVTNSDTRKYFIPGLTVKFVGAIALGFVYQFYYGGGDTMNYYNWGAKIVWEAFLDSPTKAISLITAGAEYPADAFQYASRIIFFGDLPSYSIVRVAGLLAIFTLNSYYAISLCFAAISFSGTWALFYALDKYSPWIGKWTALAVLFIPSVFFWGSGILKDTLTFASLGFFIYSLLEIVKWKRVTLLNFIILLGSTYVLYHIKIYIALSLIPGAVLFIYFFYFSRAVKSTVMRILLTPILIVGVLYSMYFAALKLGEDNRKYSLDSMIETARVSAEWLYYVSQVEGGSGYSLGDDDFSPPGLVRKFVPGVWVSLFRPYIWEVRNPVMLLTAIESLVLFGFFSFAFFKVGVISFFSEIFRDPLISFFFVFTMVFCFAIGVSTFNFGSLARYRIPVMPLFAYSIFVIYFKRKRAVR